MADVELVIKIPEEDFESCKKRTQMRINIVWDAIANGIPLPKGHGRCKDCKYFEYDHVEKVNGIPLIVAHEICSKWGDGCKTKEDGYCFLFEPQIIDKVESEQEPKTGHWILTDVEGSIVWLCNCSECGKNPLKYVGGSENWWLIKNNLPKYCPNCGAKMAESEVTE